MVPRTRLFRVGPNATELICDCSTSTSSGGTPSRRRTSRSDCSNRVPSERASRAVTSTGSRVRSLTHRISCSGRAKRMFAYQSPSRVVDDGCDAAHCTRRSSFWVHLIVTNSRFDCASQTAGRACASQVEAVHWRIPSNAEVRRGIRTVSNGNRSPAAGQRQISRDA